MKLLERKKAALDAVLAKGWSVITDKAELDDINSKPGALQRLKEQVRFRNLVGGEKLKCQAIKKNCTSDCVSIWQYPYFTDFE